METTLIMIMIFLLVVVGVLIYLLSKKTQRGDTLNTALQNLTQTVQSTHTQTSVLTEKITRLEQLPQVVGALQVDLRGLAERISTVEQKQTNVSSGVNELQTKLAEAKTITETLVKATGTIQSELTRAKEGLTEIQTNAKAREELERKSSESIRRLETIIAGTHSKGGAGENILDVVFSKLPTEWQVRNFRVANKPVEFALRLPNNLILPIDSKWSATSLLEQFSKSENPAEQQVLKKQIESAVLDKAKEVKKYIDPNLTVSFGIAAVPDAVYDLSSGILVDIFHLNVVLVSYSMFVPYLLLVFQTVLKNSQDIDLEKLSAYLQTAQESITALNNELQGRFSKALTMLENSRTDMTAHLSRVSSGLAGLQVSPNNPKILQSNAFTSMSGTPE
jgi:DNA recombination protein RmuC